MVISGYPKISVILMVFNFHLLSQLQAFAQDQAEPELIKKTISTSGCSANLPENMNEFEITLSEDSSWVYTAEADQGVFTYGCITVKFQQTFYNYGSVELNDLLSSYLSYLEKAFNITTTKGQDPTQSLQGYPDSRGIMDNWEDADGRHYAVMGWINQANLCVLYILKNGDYPPDEITRAYFNGFRFSNE
jgi:hypothetical protein